MDQEDFSIGVNSESRSYRIAEGVLWQELDKESVLLNLETEQYYALDPVGTRVWKLLAETASIDATVKTMVAEYDTEEATLKCDVEQLVQKLVSRGLLIEQTKEADGTAS